MQDEADLAEPPAASLPDRATLVLQDEVVGFRRREGDHARQPPASLVDVLMGQAVPVAHRARMREHPMQVLHVVYPCAPEQDRSVPITCPPSNCRQAREATTGSSAASAKRDGAGASLRFSTGMAALTPIVQILQERSQRSNCGSGGMLALTWIAGLRQHRTTDQRPRNNRDADPHEAIPAMRQA